MGDFRSVARATEMPSGEMKLVDLDGEEVGIANVDGAIFAFGNECTHVGGPLVEGERQGKTVTCPEHASVFPACSTSDPARFSKSRPRILSRLRGAGGG